MPSSRFRKSRAVIDASCLQCLLALDYSFPAYHLFRALSLRYYTVHIPQHVWNELVRHGRRRSQLQRLLHDYPFFAKCSVGDDYRAQLLYDKRRNPKAPIDRGEAEAIIQAGELGVAEVLIDEKRGRQIALAHTLNPRGIVGLLKEFRLASVIPEVRPLFVECVRIRFRLPRKEVDQILVDFGESALFTKE